METKRQSENPLMCLAPTTRQKTEKTNDVSEAKDESKPTDDDFDSFDSPGERRPTDYDSERFITKSICYYAAKIANDTNAKAISTLTNSGYTAYQISSWRPRTHVLVFTSNKRILTQLNLLWGVKAFYYDGNESMLGSTRPP